MGSARQGVPRARTAGGCARDPGAGTRGGGTARWVARDLCLGNERPVVCVRGGTCAGAQLAPAERGASSGFPPAGPEVQAVKAGVRAGPPTASSPGADATLPGAALGRPRL